MRVEELATLRLGLDLNARLIDTAEMYGDRRAEALVGEAIAGRRDEVFLVSKVLPSNASRRGTVAACERNCSRERLRESMTEPQRLTPEELFRSAADPDAALLALTGSTGASNATGNSRVRDGFGPKKRRKMSAAWEVMIAITEKAKRGKETRIASQNRGLARPILTQNFLTLRRVAKHPARNYDTIAKPDC